MKKLTLVGLAVLGLALTAVPAEAFGLRHRHGCESSCAPCCDTGPAMTVVWEEREVTAWKPEWKERDVTVNVCRMTTREVTDKHEATIMVPEYKDVKKTVTVMVPKPVEVVRDVCRCVVVPVCCVDPCTGCTYTVCHRQMVVEKVRYTVMQCVPEPREVTVRECSYKPEVKKWETKHLVCEWVTTPEKRKEKYCEMVSYKTKVKVAVCVPAPVCAPACDP
jgi:hypothetical protein